MKGTTVHFNGTKEQEQQLREKLRELKQTEGALMPALQYAQSVYGYLPYEVQTIVAEELGVTLSEVYGVVTFYSQFTLYPKGKYRIGICLGTACCCGLAPVMTINDDVYGKITPDDVEGILAKYE